MKIEILRDNFYILFCGCFNPQNAPATTLTKLL